MQSNHNYRTDLEFISHRYIFHYIRGKNNSCFVEGNEIMHCQIIHRWHLVAPVTIQISLILSTHLKGVLL